MHMRGLFLALCLSTLTTQVHAELSDHVLRKDDAFTGSNIKKNVPWNGPALNKRYHELSAEDKTNIKLSYKGMSAEDEPPYPLEGMRSIVAAADKIQQKLLVDGDLQLEIEIDEMGDGDSVRILKTPNKKLAELMAAVLLLSKFKPAICSGQPCKMNYYFSLTFKTSQR